MKSWLLVSFGVLCLLVSACNSNQWGEQQLKKASSLNITDARYIFKTSATAKSSFEKEGYWKMTVQGAIEALAFLDEDGKPLDVQIKEICPIGDHYLGVELSIGKYCIVDKRTGKIYTFPDNADTDVIYYWRLTGQLQFCAGVPLALECNGKLYLRGKLDYKAAYFVEIDVEKQTSQRCTPDGLDADYLVPAKNGLLAFGNSINGAYVMTPKKQLKKYSSSNPEENINLTFFTDKDKNLFLLRQTGATRSSEVTSSIYRMDWDGENVTEAHICDYDGAVTDGYWDTWGLNPISQVNGKVLFFFYGNNSIFEFDGHSVKWVGTNSLDWEYGYNPMVGYGLCHQYLFQLPGDNLFVKSIEGNKFTFGHLDLQTYAFTEKTLELFPESDYTLIENEGIEWRRPYLFYSVIRLADSHIITYRIDMDGNRTEISDNSSSFSASNFLVLN